MDVRQMVEESFEELEKELVHQLEDLSREELVWRPDEDSNSICFLGLAHESGRGHICQRLFVKAAPGV